MDSIFSSVGAALAPKISLLIIVGAISNSLVAQPYGEPDQGQPGDLMIQAYLGKQADRLHDTFLDGVKSKEDWLTRKPAWEEEFHHMLGLSPLPEKTPLKATITGTLERDGYAVDLIHYQSRPGLYVTGNLYRPSNYIPGDKLPAILYVCGHAQRGRNGNKTAYQSHGIWYAKHGYICLIVDTLQRGEIEAIHHGTYRENRWWWHSRGYTSAGVECWNGIRGIDYLVSRPDVDPGRIGVTGRSGGGAATFWIAAADDRVKAASAVSGMADLPSYVNNRVINGHCDCMFLYNTYEWPWVRIAGLLAPRPLLFVNGDVDPIFPMDANDRIINRLDRIYSLFGSSDQVDAVVSIGGHSSREDMRKATYRFMNIHLKNDPSIVLDSEVDLVTGALGQEIHPIAPEQLRVFPTDSDIPKDELNTTIDQYFVPIADLQPPATGEFDGWKSKLIRDLKEVSFRAFPDRIPAAMPQNKGPVDSFIFETEEGIHVHLRTEETGRERTETQRVVLVVNTNSSQSDYHPKETETAYILNPRGVGETNWTQRNPPNYVERSHVLLGQTVDEGRIWDIIATARYLKQKHGSEIPLALVGERAGAVLAAYAALLEPGIDELLLTQPPASHMDGRCPALLNVLRVCDVPEVLGALAPRKLSLSGLPTDRVEKVEAIYRAAGASQKLTIVSEN